MLLKIKINKTIPFIVVWIFKLWLTYFIIFTCFRLAILFAFRPFGMGFSSLFPSFLLGFQYDAKWISVILFPVALLSVYPKFSPFHSLAVKRLWLAYLAVITFFILLFFGADFGTFGYGHTRINASVLNFSEDLAISIKTVWQAYPVIWIFLGLVFGTSLLIILFIKMYSGTMKSKIPVNNTSNVRWHLAIIVFLAWCLFGIFSFTPVKWSKAFALNDNFKSYLALNPFQNFFSTLWFRDNSLKEEHSKNYYPVIAEYLDLDSTAMESKSYQRNIEPVNQLLKSEPDIVLVVCEGFSMYKSSMSGNPLNTTPYFNQLTKEGVFFNRCFTPTWGTARGIFAIVTGIPDVDMSKFSTCNPDAIDQQTIINSFKDYSKFYFLGGSGTFNNFEGLIKNINGVKIYQDGSYNSPKLNVWGISDKDLFLEANKVIKTQTRPFFSIIQTADNHRPFMIPEEDSDFEKRDVSKDTLEKYGFESLPEFQSFCYTDYCFKKFIETAKKEAYFNNTIFVFIGDHGMEGNANAMYPGIWTSARLSDEHVPLLFYSPALLKPQLKKESVSQVDVLPTVAGMANIRYRNTTLGRDLMNTKNKFNAAFIIHRDEGNIGVVTDDVYYIKNIRTNFEELLPATYDPLNLSTAKKDSVKQHLSTLTSAIYETAKWMLVNNKK